MKLRLHLVKTRFLALLVAVAVVQLLAITNGDDLRFPVVVEDTETALIEHFGCIVFEGDGTALTDTLDTKTLWQNMSADSTYLLTEAFCETDTGTFTMDLQRDDGTPADVVSNCACDSDQQVCTVLTAEDDFAIDQELDLNVDSVASSPTRVSICLKFEVQ